MTLPSHRKMKWTPTAVLAALTPLLLTRPATTMAQLYGAVDDGLGLLPRSYEAAAPALARRQAGCRTGTHPCRFKPRLHSVSEHREPRLRRPPFALARR